MLYVLNGSIAVVLFVLIFAFGVKLSKKSASKMKRGAIFPALVGLCTAVLSFLFLFFWRVECCHIPTRRLPIRQTILDKLML